MKTVPDFIFRGSKITADGDYSHEIKRCLLLGRKLMTNLDSILKSRDTTLPTKVHLVKAQEDILSERAEKKGQNIPRNGNSPIDPSNFQEAREKPLDLKA